MRMLLVAVMLVLAQPGAQAPGVVAESQAEGEWGVAAFNARLDPQHRYTLQVDGPPGVSFTVRYLQVYVSHQPTGGGSGNDDGSFQATTPYEADLTPPAPGLLFWRYSAVVSPDQPTALTARLLDRGAR
ncbi:MAG TPA: hypothetical protein VFE37_30475 [Chloroflexota bacterium]|nr:hypothetical protein [Chloroflexota bacterium]